MTRRVASVVCAHALCARFKELPPVRGKGTTFTSSPKIVPLKPATEEARKKVLRNGQWKRWRIITLSTFGSTIAANSAGAFPIHRGGRRACR